MPKFQITIEAESLPELADRALALAAQLNASTALAPLNPIMPELADKPAKKAKTTTATVKEPVASEVPPTASNAEPVAQAAPEPAPAAAEAPAAEAPVTPVKEPEVQQAEQAAASDPLVAIRELTLKLVGQGKRPKVEAILEEFGLPKTTAVDAARAEEMLAALTAAAA